MNRILKTRTFQRWMRKTLLSDAILRTAIDEMQAGLIDADLGGGVFKKRIAVPGRGKRGGARTIVATNQNNRWIFLYGFEKNERENIGRTELVSLKYLADILLHLAEPQLTRAIELGELIEVSDHE